MRCRSRRSSSHRAIGIAGIMRLNGDREEAEAARATSCRICVRAMPDRLAGAGRGHVSVSEEGAMIVLRSAAVAALVALALPHAVAAETLKITSPIRGSWEG